LEIAMLVSDNRITMSEKEWLLFQEMTFAPWRPRTIREFNALAELGAARHLVENTFGAGFIHALACETIVFGPNGEARFPSNPRRMAYTKVHGTWPTDEQLEAFENGMDVSDRPALRLVAGSKRRAPVTADGLGTSEAAVQPTSE